MGEAMLMTILIWLVAVAVAVGLVRWRLRRRNRVHPRVASTAPLVWLIAPSRSARMHRRLRVAVTCCQPSAAAIRRPQDRDHFDELAIGVLEEATHLDVRLVRARHVRVLHRRPELDRLESHVAQIEALSWRVASLRAERHVTTDPGDALEALRVRVDALEAAHREIDALEGLLSQDADRPLGERRQ